jgi:hypothetical protein
MLIMIKMVACENRDMINDNFLRSTATVSVVSDYCMVNRVLIMKIERITRTLGRELSDFTATCTCAVQQSG